MAVPCPVTPLAGAMYFGTDAMSRPIATSFRPANSPIKTGPVVRYKSSQEKPASVVVKIAQKMSAVPVALACISTAAIRPDTFEFLSEGSLYYRHESLAPGPTKTWAQIRQDENGITAFCYLMEAESVDCRPFLLNTVPTGLLCNMDA